MPVRTAFSAVGPKDALHLWCIAGRPGRTPVESPTGPVAPAQTQERPRTPRPGHVQGRSSQNEPNGGASPLRYMNGSARWYTAKETTQATTSWKTTAPRVSFLDRLSEAMVAMVAMQGT